MPWRPHSHAHVDARHPSTWGKCDRCQSIFALSALRYQMEYAGAKLINKRLRVCSRCYDKPQDQLRTVRLTADPKPAKDPRPIQSGVLAAGYAFMANGSLTIIPPSADTGNGYQTDYIDTAFDVEAVTIPVDEQD